MKEILNKIWARIQEVAGRYPAVLAAVAIYLYYLLSSVELFKHRSEMHSFLDYIMQFDSLFFLWIAAAALIQVQKMRKTNKERSEERRVGKECRL